MDLIFEALYYFGRTMIVLCFETYTETNIVYYNTVQHNHVLGICLPISYYKHSHKQLVTMH